MSLLACLICLSCINNDSATNKNNLVPTVYSYEMINTFPHDINAYTQGLEFYNDYLYESIGKYGKSELRKVDYKSGEVLKKKSINL